MRKNSIKSAIIAIFCVVLVSVAYIGSFFELTQTSETTAELGNLQQETSDSSNENTKIDIPSIDGGENQNENGNQSENNDTEPTQKTVADYSAKDNLFILASVVANLDTYTTTVSGIVNAGNITKQNVLNLKYKNGDKFMIKTSTTSNLVNFQKQMYQHNDTFVVASSQDLQEAEFSTYSKSEYLKEYGVDFKELTNYKLNNETIISAQLVSCVDDVYTFRYKIDTEKGTAGYKVNMMKLGGLSSVPKFTSCELEVVMTKDWQPVKITCLDTYSVKYFFVNVTCTSNLVETYENIGKPVQIQDEALFESKINNSN